jgi:hypothetical protein
MFSHTQHKSTEPSSNDQLIHGLIITGVGYVGESGLAGVDYIGESRPSSVAYTGMSRHPGVAYTWEFLWKQNFCRLSCVGHNGESRLPDVAYTDEFLYGRLTLRKFGKI